MEMNERLTSSSPLPTRRRDKLRHFGVSFHHARPWLAPLLRDAFLFMSLALVLLSLDTNEANGTLWWPAPLALSAAAIGFGIYPQFKLAWKQLAWFLLLFIVLLLRGMGSLNGPIPAAGIRDAQNLGLIFIVCFSTWVVAQGAPRRTLGIFTLATFLTWLTRYFTIHRTPGFEPQLWACGISTVGAVWAWVRSGSSNVMDREELRRKTRITDTAGFVFWTRAGIWLLFGWLVGRFLLERQWELAPALAMPLREGLDAMQRLWLQSLLFGWGAWPLEQLIAVSAQPEQVIAPPWAGFSGILTQVGLVGMLVVFSFAFFLLKRWRQQSIIPEPNFSSLALAAMPVLLILAGLWLGGGTHSAVVFCVLTIWAAFALTRRYGREAERTEAIAWMPTLYAATSIVLLLLALAMPVLGSSALKGDNLAKLPPDRYRAKLIRAQQRNPYDPAIPLALATSWRSSMSQMQGWSESNYQRVVGLYEIASRLDPFNPLIHLRLAQFQMQCQRPQEATATVQKALQAQPNAPELVEWLFFNAVRAHDTVLAYQMLDHGLKIQPSRGAWWERRYALARMLGQMPLASHAISIAMTANPDNSRLQVAQWQARHDEATSGRQATVPAQVPD